jgi:hypothetical protein
MDEVRRIREVMAAGGPILTDSERDKITEYAKILGTGGEHHVEELLAKIEEGAKNQPVITMRMVSTYI